MGRTREELIELTAPALRRLAISEEYGFTTPQVEDLNKSQLVELLTDNGGTLEESDDDLPPVEAMQPEPNTDPLVVAAVEQMDAEQMAAMGIPPVLEPPVERPKDPSEVLAMVAKIVDPDDVRTGTVVALVAEDYPTLVDLCKRIVGLVPELANVGVLTLLNVAAAIGRDCPDPNPVTLTAFVRLPKSSVGRRASIVVRREIALAWTDAELDRRQQSELFEAVKATVRQMLDAAPPAYTQGVINELVQLAKNPGDVDPELLVGKDDQGDEDDETDDPGFDHGLTPLNRPPMQPSPVVSVTPPTTDQG
jgi:hypothetical protein